MSGAVMAGMVFLSSTVANAPGPRRYSMGMARLAILSPARMGVRAEEDEIGHRVAIDIGGTFTDLAAIDVATGELVVTKAPTTPARLDDGVMAALERSGVPASSVESLVHGTTVVINAITERRGVHTALVTTRGFEMVSARVSVSAPVAPGAVERRSPRHRPFVRCSAGGLRRARGRADRHGGRALGVDAGPVGFRPVRRPGGTSTTLVLPGQTVMADELGNLVLSEAS